MYTELILGAELKKETPDNVIDALKYIVGESEKPKDFPLHGGRCEWLLQGSSYYFAVCNSVSKLWKDDISNAWIISARSNIKNYAGEIEEFLEWLTPYIASGSGTRDMYAVVIYEEQAEPTL